MFFVVVSLSHPQTSALSTLPTEFTLQLGPSSEAQLASLARILKDLGAEVAVSPEGRLVAVRPRA